MNQTLPKINISCHSVYSMSSDVWKDGSIYINNFFVYNYDDIVTFVLDCQKNRNSKPTEATRAQLSKWSPNFDLLRTTDQDRVR